MKYERWWSALTEHEFQLTFRMSRPTFISLQAEIDNLGHKDNEATDELLLTCLWTLGNSQPFEDAIPLFPIENNIETVLVDYFKKITSLGNMYLSWPDAEEAELIERGFILDYGFPGVIGTIGSLHIAVSAGDKESLYYNVETKTNTIVLQVVCDNNLLLRDVCAGCPGSDSIETILKSSPLYKRLTDESDYLTVKNKHLLGGTQHLQLRTLLTPYKGGYLTERQTRFNEMHNAAMAAVEQTFKCLENRFPRLTSVDTLSPQVATMLVSAICVLHNFTRIRNDSCELYE